MSPRASANNRRTLRPTSSPSSRAWMAETNRSSVPGSGRKSGNRPSYKTGGEKGCVSIGTKGFDHDAIHFLGGFQDAGALGKSLHTCRMPGMARRRAVSTSAHATRSVPWVRSWSRHHPQVGAKADHELPHIPLEALHDGQRQDDQRHPHGHATLGDAHHRPGNTASWSGRPSSDVHEKSNRLAGAFGHAMQGRRPVSLPSCTTSQLSPSCKPSFRHSPSSCWAKSCRGMPERSTTSPLLEGRKVGVVSNHTAAGARGWRTNPPDRQPARARSGCSGRIRSGTRVPRGPA